MRQSKTFFIQFGNLRKQFPESRKAFLPSMQQNNGFKGKIIGNHSHKKSNKNDTRINKTPLPLMIHVQCKPINQSRPSSLHFFRNVMVGSILCCDIPFSFLHCLLVSLILSWFYDFK